jgi:hypothetical protein
MPVSFSARVMCAMLCPAGRIWKIHLTTGAVSGSASSFWSRRPQRAPRRFGASWPIRFQSTGPPCSGSQSWTPYLWNSGAISENWLPVESTGSSVLGRTPNTEHRPYDANRSPLASRAAGGLAWTAAHQTSGPVATIGPMALRGGRFSLAVCEFLANGV